MFDAQAFDASVNGLSCVNRTVLALQALQPDLTDEVKAQAIAGALCGAVSSDVVGESVDVFFILFSAYLVFVMQAGFAMLCAGAVRTKNTMNILLKNVLDACVGALFFYMFGFGFAYGTSSHSGFIGSGDYVLSDSHRSNDAHSWAYWFFQWTFSAAAATVVSGSVAERTTFTAYIAYTAVLTGFVYPVVAHWVWSPYGWISAFKSDPFLRTGMIDFSGSGVVHLVGGTAGLAGAITVGPRLGRFGVDGKPLPIRGHSATLVVLGTFLLWLGWFGFNPGSQLAIVGAKNAAIVSRTAVTTTLAPTTAALVALALTKLQTNAWDLTAVCNGLLAGLVGVTAGCSVIEPWAAIIVGVVAVFVFNYGEQLCLKLGIDDPLSAVPMHMMCGALGVLAVGFLAYEPYVWEVYGPRAPGDGQGVFYGGNGKQLGAQVTGVVCIIAWVGTLLGLFFSTLHAFGWLRVSREEELAGLDVSKHGGFCYEGQPGHGINSNDTMRDEKPSI